MGKTTGWIGYTLSWTNRQFDSINFGETYPYRYDRRHDIGIAVTHEINDNINIGIVWVYGTGNAVTLGLESYSSFNTSLVDDIYNFSLNNNFGNNFFDKYTISFCLRNVTEYLLSIKEAYRVLKPGGKYCCLEFSTPKSSLVSSSYKIYKSKILPLLGELVAKDKNCLLYTSPSPRDS